MDCWTPFPGNDALGISVGPATSGLVHATIHNSRNQSAAPDADSRDRFGQCVLEDAGSGHVSVRSLVGFGELFGHSPNALDRLIIR